MTPADYMREAIRIAIQSITTGSGGPFGCVIVRGEEIIGSGGNAVTSTNDPTAHAEMVAIRAACAALGTWELRDCALYTSCEPCPMCLAAAYWARIPVLYYACTRQDAAAAGFDDDFIYREIPLAPDQRTLPGQPLLREEALAAFRQWQLKPDRIPY